MATSSRRKASQHRKNKAAQTTPSEEEWETMERLADVEVGGRVFREKDDVILHSRERKENAWIASLRQIRIRKDEEIWVGVQWYQSPKNIADIVEKFNPELLCNMERAISDQEDILSAGCLKAVTRVYHFREETLVPLDIGPQDFFQRYSVGFHSHDISPVPGTTTCLPYCSRPYNPFPVMRASGKRRRPHNLPTDEVDLTLDVMHMCPRPQCKCRWYHQSCLVRAGYVDYPDAHVGDRRTRLLAANPDSGDLHPAFAEFTGLKSNHTGRTPPAADQTQEPSQVKLEGISSVLDSFPTSVAAKLEHLPPELVQIAAQPIVRCPVPPKLLSDPRLGVFSTAGTVKEVVLARRFVYQALEGGHDKLQQLCTQLSRLSHDQALEDHDMWREARETIRVFASPRKEYWQRRASLMEPIFLQQLDQCPPVFCPQCFNAI